MFEKIIIRMVLITFFFTCVGPLPHVSAQAVIDLPTPGTMVDFSPKFNQATLKGIIFHPENPFKFDFILDEGDAQLNENESKAQSQKIAAYFLASLTTPEKEIWVNLSPYEKGRIIPAFFGNTLMGQNLLAQDYMLKQIMATALYPERELGREFWQKIYEQARIRFGTTNIPINTFNKVWIVPDKAVVYENTKMNAVFVAESSLKVMLEKDYLAENKHRTGLNTAPPPVLNSVSSTMSSAVIKELVIPALEKEVNEGKNFAPLRQVYNALILAKWYKDNLRNNVIAKGYVNRNKIKGVESHDTERVSQIYHQYLKAYKKGVFNYVKEDFDEISQSTVPRKYFSGGFFGGALHITNGNRAMTSASFSRARLLIVSISLTVAASSLIPSAAAQGQQSPQEQVSAAIGNQAPAAVNLTADQKKTLLKTIKDASEGKGDPEAAAAALRQISDDSAVEYDADILRLVSNGGSWDAPLNNLLSNSSGPGYTMGVGSGFSAPLAGTNQGTVQLFEKIISTIRERRNVGTSTLRMEAAFNLMRAVQNHQVKTGSSAWKKLTKKGAYEELTRKDPDDTVMAARFLTMAAYIDLGIESRAIGGNAITGLDLVKEGLQSPNWIVKYAALAVLNTIKEGDPDNRYQGLIAQFLQQSTDKTTDIVMFEMAVSIAVKHGMITVLPTVMQSMEIFSKARPSPSDIVALRNWHAYMQSVIQQVVQLSKGNKDVLEANLGAMSGHLTQADATDSVNTVYLGLLFAAVQSGDLTSEDFVDQLNKLRLAYGLLPNVSINDVQIGPQARDAGRFLAELKNGINVEQNVHDLVVQCGPISFDDLLKILLETNDMGTVKAILSRENNIFSMGVYPLHNPWTTGISGVLQDTNNPARGMRILRGLAASGTPSEEYVPPVIQLVFSKPNPVLDSTETGQTRVFSEMLTQAAAVIAHSKIGKQELHALIADNTPSSETGALTAKLLEDDVAAVEAGIDLRTVQNQAGDLDAVHAQEIFSHYLEGSDAEITPQRAAKALQDADQFFRPSDPRSGHTIIDYFINTYIGNSAYVIEMSKVFSNFTDHNLRFQSQARLLQSPSIQANEAVLRSFQDANVDQLHRASSAIIGSLVRALKDRDPRNFARTGTRGTVFGLVSRLVRGHSDAFREAIRDAKDNADLIVGSELSGLGGGVSARTATQENAAVNETTSGIPSTLRPVSGQGIAPQTPEPVESRTISSAGGSSYGLALQALIDPKVTGDHLVTALNSMTHMNFPAYALNDLVPFLDRNFNPKFNDPTIRPLLLQGIATAEKQHGAEIMVDGLIYKAFLTEFEDAPNAQGQADALVLFQSAPPAMAADLYWNGLISLKNKYSGFADSEFQRKYYFSLLQSIRDNIRDLKASNPVKYTAVVGYMRGIIKTQDTSWIFNNAVPYILIQSIEPPVGPHGPRLIDSNGDDLGIHFLPDDGYFTTAPDQPWFAKPQNEQTIQSARRNLANTLNRMNPHITVVIPPKDDSLEELISLFDSSKPVVQRTAMVRLGWVTLLFPKIPTDDEKVFLLYLHNKYVVGDPQLVPQHIPHSPEALILSAALDTKRGPDAWDLARQKLQDNDLFTNNPEAVNELVHQIGERGGTDMVEPLLRFYVDRRLGYGAILSHANGIPNNSFIGLTVTNAIKNIAKSPNKDDNKKDNKAEVESLIQKFKDSLPENTTNDRINRPDFYKLINDISNDKAMTNGGIDLENINVQSQGEGNIKTAFDDQAQLAVLIRSEGLIPVIENVRLLTPSAINQLLGTL